jgi:hypothetical protein
VHGSRIHSSEGSFLRYEYLESSRGQLLVLMSDVGVVDVMVGDSKRDLLMGAARRFPSAGFVPDRGVHGRWVGLVLARIESQESGAVIPVDLGFCDRLRLAG